MTGAENERLRSSLWMDLAAAIGGGRMNWRGFGDWGGKTMEGR